MSSGAGLFSNDAAFALIDGDDGGALLLTGLRRSLLYDGTREPVSVLAQRFDDVEAASSAGEWTVLAAHYGVGARFEPAMRVPGADRSRLRAWVFGACERLDAFTLDALLAEAMVAMPESLRTAGIAELDRTLSEAEYVPKVERIKSWIAAGDCYQINLTFPIDFRVYGHPLALYAALRTRQPVRYGAFVAVPGTTILSFSPELFFERRGTRISTRPMKGTAPRGASPEEDTAQREAMLASAKERAENVMIVDLLRNDLGRLAAPGAVRVDALCEAEAYPTLWQQVSTVSAELPTASLADLFGALFPCGSITGAPKIRAMQCIAELESGPRELYTGALGWVAPGGDCRFNVAIRTFEVDDAGHARLGVGSGIVIDADPAREYAECLLKARFLTGFDPGFELIETLRLEHGAYPLLPLHLDRLRHSAAALGFTLDEVAVKTALAEQSREHPAGVLRVRLTLSNGGAFRLAIAALDEPARDWRVVIADATLPENDYLRGFKTSARGRYDAVLAGLPEDVFDAVFLNARGEVCEGARSNVFVVGADGVWRTPPLRCGLLPGVMRRALLEAGRAVEQVLTREDLLAAREIHLANALRGVIRVRF